MARVRFEHVYKRFGNVEVVQDINLDKEFLVLVAPLGVGRAVLATWDIRLWKRPLESDPLVPFRLQERSGKDRIREHACISYVG